MKAVTRRVYEMCLRVQAWLTAHPDDEPGMVVLVGRLQALVARMAQVVDEQRSGRIDSRAASARKQELRREMLASPIAHLAKIGSLAAREDHELRSLFVFKPTADTLLAFQAAARGMFTAARAHKEVLVKHGLSESVLAQFGNSLDELDAAVRLGAGGRTVHTAATRELKTMTTQAHDVVRAMDARNRLRYQDDRQALEQWVSAQKVLGVPERTAKEHDARPGGTPTAGGEGRPAA